MPPPTTIHHDPPPSTTTHHQPKYIHYYPPQAKIHPPLPNTSQKVDHHPARQSQNMFIYNRLLALLKQFLFLWNAIFFPWRRFCLTKFWSVRFSSFKFLLKIRSSHRRCSVRIGALRNFAINRKTPVPEPLFFIKLQAWGTFLIKLQACNFIKKETLAQVFSCEFCEISNNTFKEHLLAAAFVDFTIFEIF